MLAITVNQLASGADRGLIEKLAVSEKHYMLHPAAATTGAFILPSTLCATPSVSRFVDSTPSQSGGIKRRGNS